MIGRPSSKAQRYEFQAKFEFDRIWSIRYLVGQAPGFKRHFAWSQLQNYRKIIFVSMLMRKNGSCEYTKVLSHDMFLCIIIKSRLLYLDRNVRRDISKTVYLAASDRDKIK